MKKSKVSRIRRLKSDYFTNLHYIANYCKIFFSSNIGNQKYKLIEDPHGNFVLTSDGTTLVHELYYRIKDPILAMILESGEMQAKMCGDLVKSTIYLVCELILTAFDLMRDGLHPTTIKKGFNLGLVQTKLFILDHSKKVLLEENLIKKILYASLVQKLSDPVAGHLSKMVSDPLFSFIQEYNNNLNHQYGINRIIEKFMRKFHIYLKPGGRILDSIVEKGVGITKSPIGSSLSCMKNKLEKLKSVKIALVSGNLYHDKEISERFEVVSRDPTRMYYVKSEIEEYWYAKFHGLRELGVDILITERGIDEALIAACDNSLNSIMVFRRVDSKQMDALALQSGGRIVHGIEHLDETNIGVVDRISIEFIRGEPVFYFSNRENAKNHSLILSGSIYDICDATKHHVIDAIQQVFLTSKGMVSGFPSLFRDLLFLPTSRKHNVGKTSLAHQVYLEVFQKYLFTFISNKGKDPYSNYDFETYSIPTRSLLNMVELATATANKLIGVGDLIINQSGWNKRMGNKEESSKKETNINSKQNYSLG